jgi:transposase InsO family protein
MVCLDVIGPLPQSHRGNTHVFVAVDLFTKNVEVLPTRSLKTSQVMEFINCQIIGNHGVPKIILADNALYFKAEELMKMYGDYGIQHKFSSAYNPQENGAVERFNDHFLI